MASVNVARVLLLISVLSGIACDRSRDASQDVDIANLKSQLDSLAKRTDELEQLRAADDLLRDFDAVAFLTPGSDGYSLIRGDLGTLTVSLQNIEAYANGSRVALQFGNLTSATINGAKVKVEWGRVDAKGLPSSEGARSREVTFSQSLPSGRWTRTQVVLEGVPPAELGFIRIKEFGHSGITLGTER